MNPPSPPAMLSFEETTAVAGNGGYSKVGTIEGWVQIESKNKDPQRLLTLTGRRLSGEKAEYWIDFSPATGKLSFLKSEADAPFADGKFHHFAFTLDRDEGMSLGFDGKDPQKLSSEDKVTANLLIHQLTIGHFTDHSGTDHSGFVGKIAGLHLWKKKLTSAEIGAAGNWHASYCPTPDFGFKEIDPIGLLGYLNPVVRSFIFYYEPRGHWVMNGTESDEPKQADLPDCDQYHHSVYEAPRYFLTTREKKSNGLYIISDQENKEPLRLSPNESQQFVFAADGIILQFNMELRKLKLEDRVQQALRESFSIEGKNAKLPDQFLPVPGFAPKCYRPAILEEDSGAVEKFGDIFTHNPNNFDKSLLGWNEVHMKDPFDSSSTGAENKIFMLPPSSSKHYVKINNYVIPHGWKFLQMAFSEGSMHSALVANGSDLRQSATKTASIKGNVKGGCAFVSGNVSFNYNSQLGNTEENMYTKEVMHSQHTYFVSVHTLVLDKSNVRLSTEQSAGRLAGFVPTIHDYAKGRKSSTEIFNTYGTHYAHAICYGARGRARQTYTKETMSALLQECKKIGWGVEAKLSVKIPGYTGVLEPDTTRKTRTTTRAKLAKLRTLRIVSTPVSVGRLAPPVGM
jgi:Concanavalin A-like lectin/glucanases superfamily/MAC/Perforin domain